MCNYQGYEFGAGSYPDSVCIEGHLFDADKCDDGGNLYENDQDIPCPMCRPKEAVEHWAEQNKMSGANADDAIRAAMSLVEDIRAKRSVFDEFEPPQLDIPEYVSAWNTRDGALQPHEIVAVEVNA